MSHKDLALVLATGGGGVVKAAYSSGTPALGVGAGNVPVFIEQSADIPFAVEQICLSKTFDNGTICASEQAVVVERAVAEQVVREFTARKAYFLDDAEVRRLEDVAYDRKKRVMNIAIIGQSAATVAKMAQIAAPPDVSLLIAPLTGVGDDYPLSAEILAPILAYYSSAGLRILLITTPASRTAFPYRQIPCRGTGSFRSSPGPWIVS